MLAKQKNKTLAALLAALSGSIGIHRFYMYGLRDRWGWAHFITLPLSAAISSVYFGSPGLFTWLPLLLSFLIALVETLVIGLTPDEQWNLRFHNGELPAPKSGWPLVIILVLTTAFGAVALIGTIARCFDLLYTGGAYG